MAIRYQWVKFRLGFNEGGLSFRPDDWNLAEIDDDWPDGGVSLFGVERTVRQSDVIEWGPTVSRPKSK